MHMLLAGKAVERPEHADVTDPWDGSVVDTVPVGTAQDIHDAVTAAVEGFRTMRALPSHERAAILFRAAELVEADGEAYARLIAREGSKTIREARKEVYRCTRTLHVSGEEATRITGETILFDQQRGSENRRGWYDRVPIGVIGAITPFNDPLNLVAHKLGPAFAGGNAVVLKPATVTPLSAITLGDTFMEAGLPPAALSVITGPGPEVGHALVTDPRVRMISFTGGVQAGRAIAAAAGLKKIGMELGSNSPVIVLDDADLDDAVESCVSGAFWAAGQNCIGVQRIYVDQALYDDFVAAFVARTQRYKVGPKLNDDCDMGPMITEQEAARIERWVDDARAAGAVVRCGHRREGALYWPTVLTDVPDDARVSCEEVFAPVVLIRPVDGLDDAIERANRLEFGLHAAVFTRDLDRAFHAIQHLEAGGIMVNDSTDYRMDAMPFGGIKNSGLGREGIRFALQEMTEPRTVCVRLGG
ncbi:MAG: aldehyde dehydrogenase family protein [Gemmatimonadota bacterium]